MIDLSKQIYVYDIETDGLIDNATKIHCVSATYRDGDDIKTWSTTDYDEMREFFSRDIIRVGHNITLYDERVVANLLGISTISQNNSIIDTLALSWYLYPEYTRHSLEEWGIRVGINKVEIKDWKLLSSSEYVHRCEIDTQINFKIWELFYNDLLAIYNTEKSVARLITYLQFKMDCIREQEDVKLALDLPKLQENLAKLIAAKEEKTKVLASVMPKVPITKKKEYRNVIVISDNEIYSAGDLMYEHYKSLGYEVKDVHTVVKITGYKEPNPNSVDQKKDWLFSLGWTPSNYKLVKDPKGDRKVPQITSVNNDGICHSVKDLFEVEPKLEVLEGLSILSHRIGVLEGLLDRKKGDLIEPSALGFTNTLRLRHTNVVNLPSIDKIYGKEMREVFVANKGMILCGSDMSSLEDTTKQHYIYHYDPEYVNEMRTPGFDPHLDIAVLSGLATQQESDLYKYVEKRKKLELPITAEEKNQHSIIKPKRHKAKTTNFSATYGAGPPKIALTANIALKEAKLLHSIYWKRNSAVKKTAEAALVKSINGKNWLYNPVSGFWYSLRAEKDRFSTLNQGTGVYCFDMYILEARKRGIKISLQMHDEILFNLYEKDKDNVTSILNEAIKAVNERVKLNVPLNISIDYGHSYADCH